MLSQGQYHLSSLYSLDQFKSLKKVSVYPAKEFLNASASLHRYIVLTEAFLLNFDITEKEKGLVRLVGANSLRQISNLKRKSETSNTICIGFVDTFSHEQFHQILMFLDSKMFVNDLVERMKRYSITVTKKVHRDVINQTPSLQASNIKTADPKYKKKLVQNVAMAEAEMDRVFSIESVRDLQQAYQNLIEFCSARNDSSFQIYLAKLQSLLQRPDIDVILRSRESSDKERRKEPEELQRENNMIESIIVHEPSKAVIDDNFCIMDDDEESKENEGIGHGSGLGRELKEPFIEDEKEREELGLESRETAFQRELPVPESIEEKKDENEEGDSQFVLEEPGKEALHGQDGHHPIANPIQKDMTSESTGQPVLKPMDQPAFESTNKGDSEQVEASPKKEKEVFEHLEEPKAESSEETKEEIAHDHEEDEEDQKKEENQESAVLASGENEKEEPIQDNLESPREENNQLSKLDDPEDQEKNEKPEDQGDQ